MRQLSGRVIWRGYLLSIIEPCTAFNNKYNPGRIIIYKKAWHKTKCDTIQVGILTALSITVKGRIDIR